MIRSALTAALFLGLCPLVCLADVPSVPGNATPTVCISASNCRHQVLHVKLHSSDHGDYEFEVAPSPYVANGILSIMPGETLVFHFDRATADAPGEPTFVKTAMANPVRAVPPSSAVVQSTPDTRSSYDPNTGESFTAVSKGSAYAPTETAADHLKNEPEGTLIVSFYQIEGRADMALRVEHNLPKPLKFDTQMLRAVPNASGMDKTSTCPVRPILADMETWPYPIAIIQMTNFRYADMSAGTSCG